MIRYVAYTKAKITTSYTMHGRKGDLFLGKATKTFKKKGVFRLPKKLTRRKMKKIRAATEFAVQFQIPGTPILPALLQTQTDRPRSSKASRSGSRPARSSAGDV